MTPAQDTIAAIATAPGAGGVGIVRLSGPGAQAIAKKICARALSPRRAHHVRFLDADGGTIDWDVLRPQTREAFLDIAEAITRRFDKPTHVIEHETADGPALGGAITSGFEPPAPPTVPHVPQGPARDAYARSEAGRRSNGERHGHRTPEPTEAAERSTQRA